MIALDALRLGRLPRPRLTPDKAKHIESNTDTGVAPYSDAWAGFRGEEWKNAVNVRDFIQHNYTPYEGDEAFLAQATPATTALWQKVMVGIRRENATHAPVDFDTNIATTTLRPTGRAISTGSGDDRRPANR